MSTEAERKRMGDLIFSYEAQLDPKTKRLKVYKLPEGDGGGLAEVGGINMAYNAGDFEHLRELLDDGHIDQAEAYCKAFYLRDTERVSAWAPGAPACVEFTLRDMFFNRGGGGAAWLIQRTANILGGRREGKAFRKLKEDSAFGPKTREALRVLVEEAQVGVALALLLSTFRDARERYEIEEVGVTGKRAKFQKGLRDRWRKVLRDSLTFSPPAPKAA